MGGYSNRLLRVDLTTRKFSEQTLDPTQQESLQTPAQSGKYDQCPHENGQGMLPGFLPVLC